MVWPDKDGNDPRGAGKPPRKTEVPQNIGNYVSKASPSEITATTGERLGLYKRSPSE